MKRVTLFIAFLVAASLVLSTLVFPVGAGRPAQTGGTGTPGASDASGTPGTGIPQTGSEAAGNAFVNLQTLQSFAVQDSSGNAIGNVSDFVINLPKTRIDYIVMAGSNGRSVLVPWASLSAINAQDRTFTFKDDASRLENAPTFDATAIDFADPSWSQSTVDYWRFGSGAVQGQSGQSPSETAQPTAQQNLLSTVQPTGQAQNGAAGQATTPATAPRSGAVAALASSLLNAQVVDIASTSFSSNPPSSDNNQSGSGAAGTPQATAEATSQATSVPNTGGSQQATGGDVLGTVASAIVTRINGDIRYILVRPEGELAEQIRQASLNNQNTQNNAQPTPLAGTAQATPEATGQVSGGSQAETAQPTSIPNTGSSAQGSGEEVIPAPFDILFPSVQDGNLILRASPLMLRAAPVVQSNVDNLGFGWDQNINLFWSSGGLQGGRFPLFGGSDQLQAGGGGGVPVTGSDQAALASAAFVRLNALNNFSVQDASGNALGNVQDFVVNLPKTRIDYIVLSGSDGRTVLVPWASLASIDTAQNVFFFRYAGSQLQNAPVFDANNPNFGDPEWDNDTINYWITGRFTDTTGSNQSGNDTGNTTGQQPPATGTPVPDTSTAGTPQGTAVPNTGSGGPTGSQQGAAYAALASQLVGLPVYDQAAVDASGNPVAVSNNTTGNDQAQGTAAPTGAAQETSQATSAAGNGQAGGANQGAIGTVQGAIVTRLSGDIRYLLIAPEGTIANTGGGIDLQNQSTPQAVTPEATSAGQNNTQATAQPTGVATTVNNAQGTAEPTGIPNTGSNAQAGGNLVPAPFSAVLVSNTDSGLVLRISTFMLQNAPSLDAANLPDVLGFGWDQGVLNFWRTGSLSTDQGGPENEASSTPSP